MLHLVTIDYCAAFQVSNALPIHSLRDLASGSRAAEAPAHDDVDSRKPAPASAGEWQSQPWAVAAPRPGACVSCRTHRLQHQTWSGRDGLLRSTSVHCSAASAFTGKHWCSA